MEYNFEINRTSQPKQKPDAKNLAFGNIFTDHMFVMDYTEGKGWHDGKVVPYGPIELEPSAMVLHYGQEMFEGLKAYRTDAGEILLFRPDKNIERTNKTNDRLCIPQIDEDLMLEAIKTIVGADEDWIPTEPGTSLYIRPFIFATDPYLGVRPSLTYKFMIILCPVGAYYREGINPTKIYVEDYYVRAVQGGTGDAKTGGNYAASIKAQIEAKKKGYSQVLWLDGVERKYVEEIGTSNAFFKIDGEIITAPLGGTILPGITRDSSIKLMKSWGLKVTEKRLTIQEVYDAQAAGKLDEVFATGTAAVISPIGELCWKNQVIEINNNEIGEIAQKLYDTITGIQSGKCEDQFNWTVKL